MKTLFVLKVSFDTNIQMNEISPFCSAFFQKIGAPKNQYNGAYPLVQFKTQRSYNQQQPLLVCLGSHPVLYKRMNEARNEIARINGRDVPLTAAYVKSSQYQIKMKQGMYRYKIYNYQALNRPNWLLFKQLGKNEKLELLARRIKLHIEYFASGIGWEIDKSPKVVVDKIIKEKYIDYMGVKVQCFDLAFSSNVFLPEYIGLGKGLISGFGVVRK